MEALARAAARMRSSSSCGRALDVPVAEVQRSAALQRRRGRNDSSRPRYWSGSPGIGSGAERGAERSGVARWTRWIERHLAAVVEPVRRWTLDDPEPSEDLGADEVLGQEQPKPWTRCRVGQRFQPRSTTASIGSPSTETRAVRHSRHCPTRPRRGRRRRSRARGAGRHGTVSRARGRGGRCRRVRRAPRGSSAEAARRRARRGRAPAPRPRAPAPRRAAPRSGHLVVDLGMEVRHLRDETGDLALERSRRLRVVGAGAACEEQSENDDPAHPSSECSTDRHVKSDMSPLTAAQPQTRTVTASRSASKTTSVTSPTSSPSSCSGSGPSQRISIRSWSCSSTSCSLVRPVRT